jgi:hypothetical protein
MSGRTLTPREHWARLMTEDELLSQVGDKLDLAGYLWHHTIPARRKDGWRTPVQGDPGIHDIVAVNPIARHPVLFLELKRVGAWVSPEQYLWVAAAIEAPGLHISAIVTPLDLEWLDRLLAR